MAGKPWDVERPLRSDVGRNENLPIAVHEAYKALKSYS